MEMPFILALYGSPRKKGNTDLLLHEAVKGARDKGCAVQEFFLRDHDISPCLEIYGCKETGRCAIQDDFQTISDRLVAADGIMLASPIFFYAVSAHTKILMDRCQSFWVKKHWLDKAPPDKTRLTRKGLFLSAGATQGKKLFDGALLSVRYFFEAIDTELWDSLLCQGLDYKGAVLSHPEHLRTAYQKGAAFGEALGRKS